MPSLEPPTDPYKGSGGVKKFFWGLWPYESPLNFNRPPWTISGLSRFFENSTDSMLIVLTTAEYSYMKSDYFFKNSFFPKPPKIMNFSKTLGQYSMSKPFPFYIPIIIHIQATQAGRSTWLFCTGWLVMSMNEIEDWPLLNLFKQFFFHFLPFSMKLFISTSILFS